jgi:hypothetical protein
VTNLQNWINGNGYHWKSGSEIVQPITYDITQHCLARNAYQLNNRPSTAHITSGSSWIDIKPFSISRGFWGRPTLAFHLNPRSSWFNFVWRFHDSLQDFHDGNLSRAWIICPLHKGVRFHHVSPADAIRCPGWRTIMDLAGLSFTRDFICHRDYRGWIAIRLNWPMECKSSFLTLSLLMKKILIINEPSVEISLIIHSFIQMSYSNLLCSL